MAKFKTYTYPSDLIRKKQIRFTPSEFNRKTSLKTIGDLLKNITTTSSKDLVKIETSPTYEYIELPIPNTFSDTISHTWEDQEITAGLGGEISKIFTDYIKSFKGSRGALLQSGLTSYNPQLAGYKETSPLQFQLSWKLTPKNKTEMYAITTIIKTFRKYSMPQGISRQKGILEAVKLKQIKSPYLWRMIVSDTKIDQDFFFKDNTVDNMALTDINVDYTPDGEFYPLDDGRPNAINLSITLRTIESIIDYKQIYGDI